MIGLRSYRACVFHLCFTHEVVLFDQLLDGPFYDSTVKLSTTNLLWSFHSCLSNHRAVQHETFCKSAAVMQTRIRKEYI